MIPVYDNGPYFLRKDSFFEVEKVTKLTKLKLQRHFVLCAGFL